METTEDAVFSAHVADLFEDAGTRNKTRFTNFLDLHQLSLARRVAASFLRGNAMFYGGHGEGERLMLGVFAPWEEPAEERFPIAAVTLRFREQDSLTHRDILGSLMGLGLKREAVGDLLLEEGIAVCFLTETAARVVLNELEKVGRYGVRVTAGAPEKLPPARRYEEINVNISSPRLDCVVAALCRLSREKAAQLIRGQLAQINGAVAAECAANIKEGDILSLRGYGKFLFDRILYTTKKDRLAVLCKKYI